MVKKAAKTKCSQSKMFARIRPEKMPNLLPAAKSGSTAVNLINILCARFLYKILFGSFFLVTFWQKKHFCMKKVRIKCWWNWHLEVIDECESSRIIVSVTFFVLDLYPIWGKQQKTPFSFKIKIHAKKYAQSYNDLRQNYKF